MAKIKWSYLAIRDLKSIYEYISKDSEIYASRFINKLIVRVDQLIELPESGRVVPEKEDPRIRELIEGNYRIFYRVVKNQVVILRVHNSAKRIK